MPVKPDREVGTAQEGKRCPAPDSDSEELVPVAPDQEMGTDQEGKRCPAPDSGSEELVPAAANQDVRTRPGDRTRPGWARLLPILRPLLQANHVRGPARTQILARHCRGS